MTLYSAAFPGIPSESGSIYGVTSMRGARLLLIAVVLLCGCQWLDNLTQGDGDGNPVMPAAPPRIGVVADPAAGGGPLAADKPSPQKTAASPIQQSSGAERSGQITLLSGTSSDIDLGELAGTQTVAIVNGVPILAAEVLDRYGKQLARAKQELPAEEYRRQRNALIQQGLRLHIERRLLSEALRATLKKEQVALLENALGDAFEKYVETLKKRLKIGTTLELEERLQEEGSSLALLRDAFDADNMAGEYLRANSKNKKKIGRPELLAYYQEHYEDYAVPEQVRWQQIEILHSKHDGKAGARAVLDKVIAALRRDADFAELARRFSDGTQAKKGGYWEWIPRGTLANEKIEKALFSLPVGTVSQVFQAADGFHLVKVSDRKQAGYTPFEDVQDDIRKTLIKQAKQKATKEVIDRLTREAVIETIFDKQSGNNGS